MEKINIFLSINEKVLEEDKNEIINFIEKLNDKYEEKGIYLRIVTSKEMQNIEVDIKNSTLFFIFFQEEANNEAIEEFKMAYSNFKENNMPKIITYMKDTNKENIKNSMIEFMNYLDQKLRHYYNYYQNIDSVKLNLLLQLKALGLECGKIEAIDGKLCIDQKEILSLENIPMIVNNKELLKLKKDYKKIEDNFLQTKLLFLESPDNEDITKQYENLKKEKKQMQEKIDTLENDMLNLQDCFIEASMNQKLTKRQIYAKECLDLGNIEEAKKALDLKQLKEESAQILNMQTKIRDNTQVILQELWTRIDLLMRNKEENVQEIEEIFQEAINLEQNGCKTRQTLFKYAQFLFEQKNYEKTIEYAKRYLEYLKLEKLEEQEKEVYALLEKCYKNMEG